MRPSNVSGLFTAHDPARGSGQKDFHIVPGGVGSGQEVFEMSRVGSGRVGSGRVESGRVGPGGFQVLHVGPGHPDPIRPARKFDP